MTGCRAAGRRIVVISLIGICRFSCATPQRALRSLGLELRAVESRRQLVEARQPVGARVVYVYYRHEDRESGDGW